MKSIFAVAFFNVDDESGMRNDLILQVVEASNEELVDNWAHKMLGKVKRDDYEYSQTRFVYTLG